MVRHTLVALAAVALSAGAARAQLTPDAAGDFLSTYDAALPRNGDLDVLGIGATFDGSRFTFASRSAGDIGTTGGALFVWGINRGLGTARFAGIGITNVLFDAVAVFNPGAGTITVNDFINGTSSGPIAGGLSFSGATLTGVFSAGLLPTLPAGFASPSDFTVNLWPRVGVGNNAQISDFAPDNSNLAVATVPEPSAVALLLPAAAALAVAARRRRRAG